jgi:hypothetical protein
LEEAIKPDLRQVHDIEKKNWFHRNYTPEHAAYDKRTPVLFKEEYSGNGIIALCSKTYYCFGKEDKFSCFPPAIYIGYIHSVLLTSNL